ncbi:MAG: hypothetical protein ABR573_06190 [Candidatus Dormibacteria bacterium]
MVAPPVLVAVTLLAGTVGATAATTTTYSGRAYGFMVNCTSAAVGCATLNTALTPIENQFDTGQLPASGGTITAGAGAIPSNPIIGGDALLISTSGVNGVATSASHLANIKLLPGAVAGGDAIDIQALAADTRVACPGPGQTKSAVLTGLTVAGQNLTAPVSGVLQTLTGVVNSVSGTIATIQTEQTSYNATTNQAIADVVTVTFPSTGLLATVFVGSIQIAHAESDLHGCPAAVTTSPVSPTPTTLPFTSSGAPGSPALPIAPIAAVLVAFTLLGAAARVSVNILRSRR